MNPETRSTPLLDSQEVQEAASRLRALQLEVKRVIVGQDQMLERLLVALLARGHVLLEGVPGLAKTLAIRTLAQATGGSFRRVQFTPDLVPADLIGTRIFNQRDATFQTELGPLFANLILADEINRAPAKIQSALLEAMQERQVTIGQESFPLPNPFLVMATQNPIESEGTYFLPEAQVDRFMFKVLVGYPGLHEEITVVERVSGKLEQPHEVLSLEDLRRFQGLADRVYVHPSVIEYAVTLARATREPAGTLSHLRRFVTYGASPRASINLVLGAKALAVLRGREFALPEDVRDVAPDVLRHRIIVSYEAMSENVSVESLIGQIIGSIALPSVRLGDPHAPVAVS